MERNINIGQNQHFIIIKRPSEVRVWCLRGGFINYLQEAPCNSHCDRFVFCATFVWICHESNSIKSQLSTHIIHYLKGCVDVLCVGDVVILKPNKFIVSKQVNWQHLKDV